ncbi:Protein phosphatase 1 regulatory subunit 12B [Lucilia cuprina]|nr:Protein phosphatase 1 regulatory subunit 12B [Lucilia cuprina]
MTSLDIRNNSAVMKRAEQLKRWEESDTNQQPPVPRPERGSRIKFSSGCIFLAACLAGDKEEVLKMLEQGADINTANVDGLTALHQACIDDNLEMVEFLVEQGADINRQDNEGWTPLHATASCGFVSIARYLVEHGADVAAVNSDGDLAVDLAVDIQHLPMIDFMQKMVSEQQIDCAKARQAEEQQMLSDAKKWLRSDASEVDRPHPKTGATALHVAAAKGYTKVLSLLLAGRANVDAKDNDGWTPLHAAAHWGQKESAEMLLDAMADMDVTNYAGQTCIDVADRKMVKFLEEYRASNKRMKRRPSSQISRISDTIENHIDKTNTKIIRVEVRPENNKDHVNANSCPIIPATLQQHQQQQQQQNHQQQQQQQQNNNNNVNNNNNNNNNTTILNNSTITGGSSSCLKNSTGSATTTSTATTTISSTPTTTNNSLLTPLLPQSSLLATPTSPATTNTLDPTTTNSPNSTSTATTTTTNSSSSSINITNIINPNYTVQRSASLKDHKQIFISSQTLADKLRTEANKYCYDEKRCGMFAAETSALHDSSLERDTSCSPLLGGLGGTGSSIGSANTTSYNYNTRRSLDSSSLPNSPLHTRDREAAGSDTSSTTSTITSVGAAGTGTGGSVGSGSVGGSFNNILAADRRPSWRLKFDSGSKFKLEDATSGNTYPPNNSTIIPSAPAVIAAANSMSQRRVNSSNISSSNQSLNSIGRPVSAPPTSNLSNNSTTTASSNTSNTSSSSHTNNDDKLNDNSSSSSSFSSYPSRRSTTTATSTTSLTPDSQTTGTSTSNTVNTSTTNLHSSNNDDKDNDKENDNRSALATQAVIQRRRKPKRRSTGVVHIDMDELDPEKQDSANDNEEKEKESGSETRPTRSRVGSTASTVSVSTSTSATDDKKTRDKSENSGDNIDYKALWEAVKLENDKLKQQLKKKDDEVVQTRATLERFANATTKNSLSEIEKRERRAMERKLSELEEELKLLQKLKNENERLRAENRALTRVVSKLTSSAQTILAHLIHLPTTPQPQLLQQKSLQYPSSPQQTQQQTRSNINYNKITTDSTTTEITTRIYKIFKPTTQETGKSTTETTTELSTKQPQSRNPPTTSKTRDPNTICGEIGKNGVILIGRSDIQEYGYCYLLSGQYLDDKSSMQKTTNETPATEDEAPWRRNNVTRVRSTNESPIKNQVPDNEVSKTNNATTETDVILRRTQSFENDEKKSPPISPSVTSTPATAATTTNTSSPAAVTTPIRRSFVPPVRDEESETQRKAHAKRVRETRRSTQGVTLDEIKSAEELVKKKNSTMNNNNNNNSSSNEMQANVTNETTTTTTSTTTPITAKNRTRFKQRTRTKQCQLQKQKVTDEIDMERIKKRKQVNERNKSEQTEDEEEDI